MLYDIHVYLFFTIVLLVFFFRDMHWYPMEHSCQKKIKQEKECLHDTRKQCSEVIFSSEYDLF